MTHLAPIRVEFRLSAPCVPFPVDVRLRSFGERWVAVADVGGGREIGLGPSPREALTGALRPLGDAATRELLADLALLGPSVEIMAAQRALGSA